MTELDTEEIERRLVIARMNQEQISEYIRAMTKELFSRRYGGH